MQEGKPTLAEMRIRRLLSASRLARAASVAASTITGIERGQVPRLDTIGKLCAVLGCAPEEIAWPGDPLSPTPRRPRGRGSNTPRLKPGACL